MSAKHAFTMDQIKDIFRAGVARGTEEATAFDWGSCPSGKQFDELIDVLHTIWNEGKAYDDEGYRDWDAIGALVNAQTREKPE